MSIICKKLLITMSRICKSTKLLRNWLLDIAGGITFCAEVARVEVQARKDWEIEYEQMSDSFASQ